jgi:hypothetical protein
MRQLVRDGEPQPVELPIRSPFHQRILFRVQIDAGEVRSDGRLHTVSGGEIVERDRIQPEIQFEEGEHIDRCPVRPQYLIALPQLLDEPPDVLHVGNEGSGVVADV